MTTDRADLMKRLEDAVYASLLDHGGTHGPRVETYTIPLHHLRDAIRAGLSPLPRALAQTGADGMVLVPVEPTEEMVEAVYDSWVDVTPRGAKEVYRAMIAASQEPHS